MNAALYGGRAARAAPMDPGRLRHGLRRRGAPARHRPHLPRSQLYRGRQEEPRSASSSRMPMRITSARSSSCGRASARRSTRPASPSASWKTRRLSEPGAPKIPLHEVVPRPSLHLRPVRHRVRARRPLDPGIQRARHPHAARARPAYGRLEDRRNAVCRQHRPTRPASAPSATKACWRSSAIPPTSSATAAARARATSRSGSPN